LVKKIERVKKVLSEFHPDLLIEYSELFKNMENFKLLGNRMAHCAITFRDIIPPLTNLLNEVESRLKKSAPDSYRLLKQEYNSHQSN